MPNRATIAVGMAFPLEQQMFRLVCAAINSALLALTMLVRAALQPPFIVGAGEAAEGARAWLLVDRRAKNRCVGRGKRIVDSRTRHRVIRTSEISYRARLLIFAWRTLEAAIFSVDR